MNEKEIRNYLRRQFRPAGWTLTVYYGIMNLMVAAVILAEMLLREVLSELTGRSIPGTVDYGNASGYLLTIAIGCVVLYAWKGTEFWEDEIFKRGKPCHAGSIFALIVLMLGLQLPNSMLADFIDWITGFFGADVMGVYEQMSQAGQDNLSMFLYAGLAAPIAEEILFRGLLLRSFAPYGRRFAIFASALLFSLFHGNLVQIPYAFCVGLLLGYTAMEYSIGWSILLHMVNNLLFADSLSRLLDKLPQMVGNGIQILLCAAFTLGGITILVFRRKEIQNYFRFERMDGRCVSCFFLNSGTIVFLLLMLINIFLSLGF